MPADDKKANKPRSDRSAQGLQAALKEAEKERESLRRELAQAEAALAESRAAVEKLSAELRDKSAELSQHKAVLRDVPGADVSALLEDLRRKELRIAENIEIARGVSELLRPALLPAIAELDVAVRYNPTKGVGADLYDVIDMGHRCFGILVADAAGSGLQATLLAAMTKMAFKTFTAGELSPLKIMNRVNAELCEHTLDGQYLTAFFGVLDCATLKLHYVNASLHPPVLVRGGECLPLDTEGMFLAMFDTPQYEEKALQLEQGDKLFLYTDGFVQAIGDTGEPYRNHRLYGMLAKQADEDAETTVDRLEADLLRYTGGAELDDDVTMLAVQVLERRHEERVFVIPTDPEDMQEVDVMIVNALAEKGYGERVLFGIKLALEEAVINAMRHGNRNDKSKNVTVTFRLSDEEASISIADEGPGFRLEDVPDPTLVENLEIDHGRGIFLMRAYMDEVSYNEKGNEVTMVKRAPWLTDDEDSSADDEAEPPIDEADEVEELPELDAIEEDDTELMDLEPADDEVEFEALEHEEDEDGGDLPSLEPAEDEADELDELEPADDDLPALEPIEDRETAVLEAVQEDDELPELEPSDDEDELPALEPIEDDDEPE